MLKKLFVLALTVAVLFTTFISGFSAENKGIGVEADGKALNAVAEVSEGRLYLPLRAVCEALGYEVKWYAEDGRITVGKPGMEIVLLPRESKLMVNGKESYVGDEYRNFGGKTYMSETFFNDSLRLSTAWDKAAGKVSVWSLKENPITITTQKELSESQNLKLTIQYPELSGLENAEVQDQINAVFRQLAETAKNEGLENAKYITQDQIEREIKAETYLDYDIKYNRNNLLSIVFRDYQYSGGAHGMTVQSSYTFDLGTGKEYKLGDFFKEGADYVDPISKQVKDQLAEQDMTVLLAPFDKIRADHPFYLTNDAIVVYFQQYEILPYAYGIPEFAVKYSSLSELLKPEFGFLADGGRADIAPSPDSEFISKPQVEVPVDMELVKASQQSVDQGHSPWQLDPLQVTMTFVSVKIYPEGVTGEFPIKMEDMKVLQKTDSVAVIQVSGDKTPISRVYLKRFVRQDDTGIWTVVGYDPKK